jgi:ribonucleoside-diphosphate reductase alpha chain
MMDYIFRRLALDYLPYEKRSELGIFTADERAEQVAGAYTSPTEIGSGETAVDVESLSQSAPVESPVTPAEETPTGSSPAPKAAHSSAELLEIITGKASDAPLCLTCGIKMRPAGSCYVCEGCGSTSGCS